MKKILLCFLALLFVFLHIPVRRATAFNFEGLYTFCTPEFVDGEKCHTTKSGEVFFVSCASEYATDTKQKLDTILCEMVSFEGDEQLFWQTCRMLGKKYFCYSIGKIVVVEGYGQNLYQPVSKQGCNINFQVAYDGNRITVGTPLIMGSF